MVNDNAYGSSSRGIEYSVWRKKILEYVETDDSLWCSIGDWLYPRYDGGKAQYNHLCIENFRRGTSEMGNALWEGKPTTCLGCGKEMPDGIKMIALLEQL